MSAPNMTPDTPKTAQSEEVLRARMAEGWNFLTGLLVAGQLAPEATPADRPPIPLTILTGFLGAGKTTLVNHLLENPGGRRIIVLVNDFGAINIDEKLIVGRSLGTVTLSNGCACCSLAGDLSRKLREIGNADVRPDTIVLEASGLSDPYALAQVAAIQPAIRIDGIVGVLDAEQIEQLFAEPTTAELVDSQVKCADLLVLNKLDLLSEAQRAQTLDWLHSRASGRPVIEAVFSKVPLDLLLGIHRESPGPARAAARSHLSDFESVSLACEGPLDEARIRAMLNSLPSAVVRAKGVLSVEGSEGCQTIYQRVGRRWSFAPGQPTPTRSSSLVVIAPRGVLDQLQLQRDMDVCRVSSPARL